MKKNYLIALFALICNFASAQFIETTTYRGAFAPAPAAAWTDSWTNFDPQNTTYPTSTVTVAGGDINSNTTWSTGNTYTITGPVYVRNGATLTIQPGVVIYGANSTASLIITKGSKINAVGTASSPIVFTSSKAIGSRLQGDWGGVILLGNASYNINSGSAYIEGIEQNADTAFGGGASPNNADNSGTMQYVRIEFPGVALNTVANSEINGLTFGAVGSGTTIDHIQVSYSGDDAFEWFGGSVNCKYLVSLAAWDDDWDTDNGYNGNVQFGLTVRAPEKADQSRSNGFESDNNATSAAGTSYTSASFYNMTVVGPTYRSTLPSGLATDALYQYALHLRRNTQLKIYNSVFMDYTQGLRVDGPTTQTNAQNGTLIFNNNLLAGIGSNAVTTTTTTPVGFTTTTVTDWYAAGGNTILTSSAGLLTKPYDTTSGLVYTGLDFRPATVTAPSVTSSTISYSVGDVATQLSAIAASGATLNWYTVPTGGTASTTAPTPATTAEGSTTYYVAQTSAMGVESARTSITVNVIPAAPIASSQTFCAGATVASLTATGTAIKWYTANDATTALNPSTALSTATYYVSQTVSGAESTRTAVSVTVTPLTTTGSVTTSICAGDSYTWPANGITYTTAQTGVTVVSDCNTATLNLTIQAAPNAGTNGVIYLNPGVTPTNAQLFAGLNGNPTVGGTWSNIGNVYTYTVAANSPCTVDATATVTVSESIPTALSFCKGATVASAVLDSSLKFYTAATKGSLLAGTTALATKTLYATQTVNGIESSRVAVAITVNELPTTPTPLVLTQGATVIKKVGNFIGSSTELTLTATAAGTVPTASFNWTLPTDVAQVSGESTGVIKINFLDVAAANTSLDFLVSSVSANGCVSKTAKKLTVTRSVPGAPKGLTITDAELPSVTKITKLDAYTGALKTRVLTLTATPNVTAGSEATSYKWVLPAGVTTTATPVVGEANTYTSASNVISIDLANYTNETSFSFQVYAVNGNGTSSVKSLTCSSAAPKTPAIVASTSTTFNTCTTRTYTATDILGATYNWTIPGGASIVGSSTGNVIEVSFSGVTTAASYAVTCSATNGTGTSTVKSLTIKRAATCAKIALENVVAEDELSVIAYPNPSSDEFTIEASRKGASVKVYDMMGRLIENRQATSNAVQVGRNYASGIYNVIVSQGAKAKTLKVIKR